MKRTLLVLACIATSLGMYTSQVQASSMVAWVGCDGTVVSRTDAGKLEISYTDINTLGCTGPRAQESIQTQVTVASSDVSTPVNTLPASSTLETSSGVSVQDDILTQTQVEPSYNSENGPLLDLAQKDIVNYRLEEMKKNRIKYINAVRSVRMRLQKTKESMTLSYLMKNDAVVTEENPTGWTRSQGALVNVVDARENTISASTGGKATGYIATHYLRDPNSSDLVRVGQADQAYWSDVAHVNVAHLVNVRAHPWYGSKILHVLSDKTPLYVVSTVDNWSEVMSDDGMIRGYIRSDYLTITKYQRVEQKVAR